MYFHYSLRFFLYWRAARRFWLKTDKNPRHKGCWIWGGCTDRKGYGFAHLNGKSSHAHRIAYQLAIGPIPHGLHIHHKCSVPACVRPSHLEPLTDEENNRRANTFRIRNRLKSHCMHGHPFSLFNTYYRPSGERECRACRRQSRKKPGAAYWREYRLERRLAGRPVGRRLRS